MSTVASHCPLCGATQRRTDQAAGDLAPQQGQTADYTQPPYPGYQASADPAPPGGYPGQPGGHPGQAAGYLGQPGGHPGQPGGYQGQAGGYQGQPGGHPGQAAGYPGQPGGYPSQPGGYQGQAGGYPGQAGGYPGQAGGYQPGGYWPQQQAGYAAAKTNALAIVSLVLGIVWFFWIGSLVGLILGLIALRQIRERDEGGRGIAIAGIVLGAVGVAILALLIILAAIGAATTPSNGN